MIDMKLVSEADPILLKPCEDFDFNNPQFDPKEFADSLYEMIIKKDGLGISANQVGHSLKVFAIRTDPAVVLFNPKIVNTSDNLISMKEGCLSFPLLFLNVKRPDSVRVRFQDYTGETKTELFIGMTARIVLHEYDHLDGKVYISKATSFESQRALRKRMILQRKSRRV